MRHNRYVHELRLHGSRIHPGCFTPSSHPAPEAGRDGDLTQDADRPYGPCIDERARIGNAAKADAVVSVHADGSGTGNRGFHVILPALVKGGAADTTRIVGPSRALGERIAREFALATGTAPANYIGGGTGLTYARTSAD